MKIEEEDYPLAGAILILIALISVFLIHFLVGTPIKKEVLEILVIPSDTIENIVCPEITPEEVEAKINHRYFIVMYAHSTGTGRHFISTTNGKYVSLVEAEKHIANSYCAEHPIITNIIEVSEEDFNTAMIGSKPYMCPTKKKLEFRLLEVDTSHHYFPNHDIDPGIDPRHKFGKRGSLDTIWNHHFYVPDLPEPIFVNPIFGIQDSSINILFPPIIDTL